MDLSIAFMIAVALAIGSALFYGLGRLLGKWWWALAVPVVLLLLVSALITLAIWNAEPCAKDVNESCDIGTIIGIAYAAVFGIPAIIMLIAGLPLAYLGSRHKITPTKTNGLKSTKN